VHLDLGGARAKGEHGIQGQFQGARVAGAEGRVELSGARALLPIVMKMAMMMARRRK